MGCFHPRFGQKVRVHRAIAGACGFQAGAEVSDAVSDLQRQGGALGRPWL